MCDTRLPCSGDCTLSFPVWRNCIQHPVCRQGAYPWTCIILWWADAVDRESPGHMTSRPKFKPQPQLSLEDTVSCLSLLNPHPCLVAFGWSLLVSLPMCLLWPCFGAASTSPVLGQFSFLCLYRVFHLGVFQVPVAIPAPVPRNLWMAVLSHCTGF